MHIRALVLATALVAVLSMALAPRWRPRPATTRSTLLVKFRSGADAARGAVLDACRASAVTWAPSAAIGDPRRSVSREPGHGVAARRERAAPRVAYAEPNFVLHALATPNDALYTQEYGAEQHRPDRRHGRRRHRRSRGLGPRRARRVPDHGRRRRSASSTPASTRRMRTWPARPSAAPSRSGIGDPRRLDPERHLRRRQRPRLARGRHDHGEHEQRQGVAGVAFNSPLVICKALGGPPAPGSRATSPTASPGPPARA